MSEKESKEIALLAARSADDKKASDIVILELSKLLYLTDYFLICSGASDRQTKTIAEHVKMELKQAGRKPIKIAGDKEGDWILLDFGDVIVHVFTQEMRDYYQLERLWKDAPRLAYAQDGDKGK